MQTTSTRKIIFTLHRYLGLVLGLILVIVGLTGSILVFYREINHALVIHQYGQLVPVGQPLPFSTILDIVKNAVAKGGGIKFDGIDIFPNEPYFISFHLPGGKSGGVIIDPYTGKLQVADSTSWMQAWLSAIYSLHYQLLMGRVGEIAVGIAAFLFLILSVTGTILWSGWRKLINGFKIKWNAHSKRVNFDIHKVVGILASVFFILTAFTGFCWNFINFMQPAVYALTFTPIDSQEMVSQPLTGRSPFGIDRLLQTAEAILPGGQLTFVSVPGSDPKAPFRIYKRFPRDAGNYNNYVYLDQYTGKILKQHNSNSSLLGERIWSSFEPLHYGTFGGLPTRILYVFVGFAPLVLLITGFVMWGYRKKEKSDKHKMMEVSKG